MKNKIIILIMLALMPMMLCCCDPFDDFIHEDDSDEVIIEDLQPEDGENMTKEDLIGEKEAIRIVLDRTGGSQEDILSFSMEMDDGFWVYEGEVINGNAVYEFSIDATNGNLLEWEMDD